MLAKFKVVEVLDMEKIRKMLPYLFVMLFAFYVLPLLIQDTGSGMFVMLILMPVICFIVSFFYGLKNSFNWLLSLFIMLLFVPTIFIFYNESASIYILTYGIISTIAQFIGNLLCKKNH